LHSKCRVLGGLSLDHRRPCLFEHLLSDLGQAKRARTSVEQSDPESFLQECDAATDP
jgi:hypothetical protein